MTTVQIFIQCVVRNQLMSSCIISVYRVHIQTAYTILLFYECDCNFNNFLLSNAMGMEGGDISIQDFINDLQESPESQIQKCFRGSNILITGGTGFIGKVLIEKLLRYVRKCLKQCS